MTTATLSRLFLIARGGPLSAGNSGFSLIELMVVVAIIGILAVIAQPQIRGMICRAREAAVAGCAKAVRDDYIAHYNPNAANPYAEFVFAGRSAGCVDKLATRCIYDVNGDRVLDSTDPNQIVILLNAMAANAQNMEAVIKPKYVYDQNGDGAITAMDVLRVINKLNDPDSMKRY